MNVRAWILLGLLSAAACSDDTIGPEPAEFAELCGEVGPVQILALDPDRPLAHVHDRGLFGERRVLDVGYLAEDASLPILVSDAVELWSVGPCGEDPLKIAEGERLRLVTYPDVWPDMLFACDKEETGHISTVDPTGVRPANVVFETHGCFAWETDDGLLTILPHDEETGALVLQPWPEDPWTMKSEPIVILDPVRIQVTPPHSFPTEWEVLTLSEDDYFVLTPNDELVAISRIDAETTTIATDVYVFDTDSTGRYVVWQSLYAVNDDPEWPKGPITFLDRQTGEDTLLLGEGGLYTTFSPFSLASLGIMQLLQSNSGSSEYFYRLPTLEPFEMPTGVSIWGPIDETRVLISGPWYRGPYRLFDTVTLELTELYDGSGQAQVRPDDNDMLVLDGVDCCIDENSTRKHGRLVRVSFDGEIDLLARRATLFYQFTTDGRVVTTVDKDTNLVGSLIVVDPDTLDEYLVSDSVLGTPSAQDEIEGDPIVSYTIIDPERQGVWLARLAD